MTHPHSQLTVTELIAASMHVLQKDGYLSIRHGYPEWNTASARLFEDEYSVVGVAAFATCGELLRSWAELQGALVDVMSRKVGASESKAWDGYLVLFTPAIAPSDDDSLEAIRYDTMRLRKLVATGDDLTSAGDVERLLRPLLPLQLKRGEIQQGSVLELLPDILAERKIDRATTTLLVDAFLNQKPLMDALHQSRNLK